MTFIAAGGSSEGVGFLVIALLGVACYLLFRSMTTRLRNVRRNAENWPVDDEPPSPASDD